MSLPANTRFTAEVRWYLSSYTAASDVHFAIQQYPAEQMTLSRWQIYWAGVCALLKTSIFLLQIDAKRCFPGPLKRELREAWRELGRQKEAYPLFWQFVDRERNNILKEYEFSAYARYLAEDGEVLDYRTFFDQGPKQIVMIRNGVYAGRDALELASEAATWTRTYIEDAVRRAGLDPEMRVSSENFLRLQQGQPIVADPETPLLSGSAFAQMLAGLASDGPLSMDGPEEESPPTPPKEIT